MEDYSYSDFSKKLGNTIFNVWNESRFCIDDPKNELYLQGDRASKHIF